VRELDKKNKHKAFFQISKWLWQQRSKLYISWVSCDTTIYITGCAVAQQSTALLQRRRQFPMEKNWNFDPL